MKLNAIMVGTFVFAAAIPLRADYEITFQTYDIGDNFAQHIVYIDTVGNAVRATGPGYMGQLYVGSSAGSLGAIGTPVAFNAAGSSVNLGAGPINTEGFIDSSTISVTGTSLKPGDSAFYELRAWKTSDGASYELAAANPNGHIGSSLPISITLGGTGSGSPPPVFSATANTFASFAIVAVPEPSVIALGLLGGAALILRRRK